jgi:hypothetical protein
MTGEQMVTRFPGPEAALQKFWDDKEPGTISEFRIMEYFRVNGYEGPLREMLTYLLPREFFRILMECKANGTLDQFFFSSQPFTSILRSINIRVSPFQ